MTRGTLCGASAAGYERDATCSAKHQRAAQCSGRSDGAARRVRVEPAGEEAGGAGVWVAEDGGGDEEGEMAGMREGGMEAYNLVRMRNLMAAAA